ncbi:MAG: MarR family transcriptional regulator [Erysipelotrichaceae bacterium]|nr:MarR family transcriptional regulator [Erysipelotrichaceae bacterium]
MRQDEYLQMAYRQMMRLKALVDQLLKDATEGVDLTRLQLMMMKYVQSAPMSIGELTKTSGMDQGNVSSTCKKLENKGWLERKRSEKDERVVMVSLSEKGKTILSQIEQYAYTCANQAFSSIQEDEIKMLLTSMGRVIKSLEEVLKKGEAYVQL